MLEDMRRREFIGLLGGAAAWPVAARAQQQPDRVRRIGVLQAIDESDPEAQLRKAAFVRRLQELGWTDGRNVRIDYRSAAGDDDRARRYATALVALAPDVVLASGASIVSALQRATRTVPIVFVNVIDPVGAGFVDSLSRPGGNATVGAGGLMSYGPSITHAYRQAGIYAGRILKGEKPADLPVMQATKFEFVINLKTAKALGLDIHPQLHATVDEVIE
jgi:putative ABC transport system substrate-binding protein